MRHARVQCARPKQRRQAVTDHQWMLWDARQKAKDARARVTAAARAVQKANKDFEDAQKAYDEAAAHLSKTFLEAEKK